MTGIKTVHMSFSEIQRGQYFQEHVPEPRHLDSGHLDSGHLDQRHPDQNNTLGMVHFVPTNAHQAIDQNLPALQLNAPVLEGAAYACELWLDDSNAEMQSGRYGDIQYRFNNELLFGVIQLKESEYAQKTDKDALQMATESAYRQIMALIDNLDYPHLYRFWNYMANINGSSHALERYRHFNVGRKHVLIDSRRESGHQLPAACALGLADCPLSIAFLVGRTAAQAIENPRQVSAYDYPPSYGPRPPSFSRATLLHRGQNLTLFISGTASIVGHQTLHATDVIGQTQETLANLDAVIAEANRKIGTTHLSLRDAVLRVYIRHAADLPAVRTAIACHFGSAIKALFVQADICRAELLLEIEATVHSHTITLPAATAKAGTQP